MKFRDFIEEDFDCYSGLITHNPMISDDVINLKLGDFYFVGIAIVDGRDVSIHLNFTGPDTKFPMLCRHDYMAKSMRIVKEFAFAKVAITSAEEIPENPTADYFFTHGYRLKF